MIHGSVIPHMIIMSRGGSGSGGYLPSININGELVLALFCVGIACLSVWHPW